MPKNWYLKEITQERTTTGEKFGLVTNTPCHLWMRWTLIPPKTHRIAIKRRGIIIRTDLYFCFDVYEDNEQAEPDDTIIHTFTKEPWPYCQERWYYYHGEIDGKPSKSTSATFYKHPVAPLLPPTQCYEFTTSWTTARIAFADTMGTPKARPRGDSADFVPISNHPINQMRFKARRDNPYYDKCGLDVRLYRTNDQGYISPPILARDFIPASAIPDDYTTVDLTINFPPVNLLQVNRYAWAFFPIEEGLPRLITRIVEGVNPNYQNTTYIYSWAKDDLAYLHRKYPAQLYWQNWIIS